VVYRPAGCRLYCPCHEGFFDAQTGKVLGGPPPRPLPEIKLEVQGKALFAVGVKS
jgi:Rieske Fe-S protein